MPYYSNTAQTPLAFCATQLLRGNVAWRHSCGLQELCVSVKWSKDADAVCISWMYSAAKTSILQPSSLFYTPTLWNSLPSALHDSSCSLNTFRRPLKAYLFEQRWTQSGAVVAFLRVLSRLHNTHRITVVARGGRRGGQVVQYSTPGLEYIKQICSVWRA